MPSSWFYHNYPKAAAKGVKAIMIWLMASIVFGFVVDSLFAKQTGKNQAGQIQTSEFQNTFQQNKSLLISIATVALVLLISYFILQRTSIIKKIKKRYLDTQSSLTTFTEKPTSRDFNELGD